MTAESKYPTVDAGLDLSIDPREKVSLGRIVVLGDRFRAVLDKAGKVIKPTLWQNLFAAGIDQYQRKAIQLELPTERPEEVVPVLIQGLIPVLDNYVSVDVANLHYYLPKAKFLYTEVPPLTRGQCLILEALIDAVASSSRVSKRFYPPSLRDQPFDISLLDRFGA